MTYYCIVHGKPVESPSNKLRVVMHQMFSDVGAVSLSGASPCIHISSLV